MTDNGEETAAAAPTVTVPALQQPPAAAAAAAALVPAQQPLCPMLVALGRDRDSCALLCEFLRLPEMAALHASCRSWRRWIDPPPGQTESVPGPATSASSQPRLNRPMSPLLMVPFARVAQLLSCRWVRRFLDQLVVFGASMRYWDPLIGGPLQVALPLLSSLPLRLRRFEVHNNTTILRFVINSQSGAMRIHKLQVHVGGVSQPHWLEQLMQPQVQAQLSELHSFTLTVGSIVWLEDEPSLAPLARLPALDTFRYSKPAHAHTDFSVLVSSLIQCRRLTHIDVGHGMKISTADLSALLSGMPQLRTLILRSAQLQSVGSLATTSELESLTLDCCWASGSTANPEWRDALPPLAHLTSLSIIDADNHRLSARDAEPLNRRLMEKMSNLQKFTQNLLRGASVQ